MKNLLIALGVMILALGGSLAVQANNHNYDELAGTSWNLMMYNEIEAEGTVSFDDDTMYSQFCNMVGQGYLVTTGGLVATGPGVSTLMYCEGLAMDMEAVFMLSEETATQYEITDDMLTITFDSEHEFVFMFDGYVEEDEDDAIMCPAIYDPVCGEDGRTYGNNCEAMRDDVAVLYSGECGSYDPFEDETCIALFDGCNSCAKMEGEAERACTKIFCPEESMDVAYCTHFADETDEDDTDETMTEPTEQEACNAMEDQSRSQSTKTCIMVGAEVDTRTDLEKAFDLAFNVGMTTMIDTQSFRSDDRLTREEAAKMFVSLAVEHYGKEKQENDEKCVATYSDDTSFDYTLRPFIYDACGLGMMRGASGTFMAQESLTRGESLAILMRLVAGYQVEPDTNDRWMPYVTVAQEMEVMTFTSTDDLNQPILRGELIQWVNIVVQK